MPYGSNAELPPAVKKLPARKQRAFREAFNSALKQYGSESKAFAVAWSAAKAASAEEPKKKDAVMKADKKRKRGVSYDPRGRELSRWEEEEEDEYGDRMPLFAIKSGVSDARTTVVPFSFYDAIDLDDKAKVEITADGYLKAQPRIARSCIQLYAGDECDMPHMDEVRVFRPETEVFHKDAVKTYTHLPVTLDHPPERVTPDNHSQYSVGHTGDDVLRDGDAVRVPMMLRDKKAIDAYRSGKMQQLSVGYDCDLEWTSGVTSKGEKYDAIQRNIRANHLAVVAAARGGPTLRIGDKGDTAMNMKTVTIDGIDCQMTDTAAQIVQRVLTQLADQAENFKKKAKESDEECDSANAELAKRDEAIKLKDGEIAALKQQLADASDPKKQDKLLADRLDVIRVANKLLGDGYKADGKDIPTIRRDVVSKFMGDAAKSLDDKVIEGAFLSYASNARPTMSFDQQSQILGNAGSSNMNDARAALDKAYRDYDQMQADAWRGQSKQ